ncbi:MAG: hypothetical protein MJE63_27815 [Proteobacteria bacterium]|nr:hypothetical protein [Pseudomonadota bacterium]
MFQALLINTLFFFGLSHGSLMASAILTLTHAKWGRPVKRLAESTAFFIPVSWILFLILFAGMDHLFLWADPQQTLPQKTWWLNRPFFVIRNAVLVFITGLIGIIYVAKSIKPDLAYLQKKEPALLSRGAKKLTRFLKIQESKNSDSQVALAALYVALFIVLCCLVAFDWMMSLDQEWISTAFGFQYTVANLYAACAFLVLGFALARRHKALLPYFSLERLNDLSRLLLVTSLLWTYLVFSQVLVIWYANLPEETPYLLLRMKDAHWDWLFDLLFVCLFAVPLLGLLTKKACRSPLVSSGVAIICLIGLWLEKYFLTVPTIQQHLQYPGTGPLPYFSIFDIAISLGMLAVFLLSIYYFLRIFPILPCSDPLLSKE